MFINTAALGNPQIIPLLKNEYNYEPDNVYIFSEDDFARKIVHEVKNTSLEVLAEIKGMSLPQFCSYLSEAIVSSFDSVSCAFVTSIYKLYTKKITLEIIASELGTDSGKVEEIVQRAKILELAEQIEDEEILREITERAEKYGGIEAMLNVPGIPADEVYKELGISDTDLSKVEDVGIV